METPEPGMETCEPRKRRWTWRQYSLSTLLVVVTILSVGLGVVTSRAERQRRTVAAIRDSEGWVRYDFEDNGTPDDLPGPDWLCRILGVDYFADVTHVLIGPRGSDAHVAHLARLTSLQSVRIAPPVSDAGVAHLAGLTSLRELCLFTELTDAHLAHLARLTSLQSLYLGGTQITDAGVAHLAGLTSLKVLDLQGDDGIDAWPLLHVQLATQVSDAGLAHLAGLKSLEQLHLHSSQVTDAGVAHLARLTSLRWLHLCDTRISATGWADLRQALPGCSVEPSCRLCIVTVE